MKVVAFNGSPRKDGNTRLLIEEVFKVLQTHGIETELIQVGGTNIRGCQACEKCRKNLDFQCSMKNDIGNDCIRKAHDADAIIFGSPTYFSDVTAEMKALLDRLGYVSRANGNFLNRKVGASVVAVRRGGATHAFDTMNHTMQICGMFIVGATYWNMGYGREKGEVLNDSEGMKNMKALGENMAWLLERIHSKGKDT
ncbi:MAG TPA: flavodoxin family protein [Bacteroidia bacterium]|nr:flavodoxin family protein [Bacteroidia bacterium]HRS58808.1 flavodoxin family protein [Bacteroidia bacterium]HRU68130.1 flavodoxin family protein [Bacteroidia bacterium]